MPQYVQHKSGQGEKWEVDEKVSHYRVDIAWQVPCKDGRGGFIHLPKSEYIPCDPPTIRQNVTANISDGAHSVCKCFPGYYWRKISTRQLPANSWAFIVEQEVPQ